MAHKKVREIRCFFFFFFFEQDDKTSQNHERIRAESKLFAPGSQPVYFSQFQMQNPAFQVHTQPQSTPGTALEIPAGKPKVGQGQALSTSPPPTTPATPRQCPCTLHLRSIVWVFHLATLRSQHAQDQTMPSKSWHGTLS